MIVNLFKGGENGEGRGLRGCEYLSVWIREKYCVIFFGVGDCRSRLCVVLVVWE